MDRGPDPGDDVCCVWVGDTRGALSHNVSQVPEHNPLLSEAGVICAFLLGMELGASHMLSKRSTTGLQSCIWKSKAEESNILL